MSRRRGRPEREPRYRVEATARLGLAMRALRNAYELTLTDVARLSGWSVPYLSNVEEGRDPAPGEIVRWYEEKFEADGQLFDLHRAVEHERRARDPRRRGRPPRILGQQSPFAVGWPEDRVVFLEDVTTPDGTIVAPGERFEKAWRIQNGGGIIWEGRWLTRQDPDEPDTLESAPRLPISRTEPGETVELKVEFTAPHLRRKKLIMSTWRMADDDGRLFWPETYTHGYSCLVIVLSEREHAELITGAPESRNRLELLDARVEPAAVARAPKENFRQLWRVRNVGEAAWVGFQLERIGPTVAPGAMRTAKRIPIPRTLRGQTREVALDVTASGVEGSSVATFRVVDRHGETVFGGPLVCESTVRRPH